MAKFRDFALRNHPAYNCAISGSWELREHSLSSELKKKQILDSSSSHLFEPQLSKDH